MLPLLAARIGKDADMGDLEFIQEKVLAGDYFQVSGDINALNDTIEYIVPVGKTAFLIEAKIVISTHSNNPTTLGTTSDRVKAELLIDTVTKDTTNIGVSGSASDSPTIGGSSKYSAGFGNIGDGKFNVIGLSLVGNGSKKIEIKNTLDNGSAFATMSGYLV